MPFSNVSLTSNCSLPDEIDTSNTDTSPYPSSSPNDLTICHLNVQSLLSKQDELSDYLLQSTSPTILGLSETWLTNSVSDTSVTIDGFTLFRKDRMTGRGGGILVYIPSSMRCRRRTDLEKDHTEALWLEVHTQRSSFLLCNIYRPPSADLTFIEDLDYMLELAANDRKEMLVMGDFNCNILSPNPFTRKLTSMMHDYQLNQIISVPTRISARSRTLIDLCFTSPNLPLSSSGVSPLTGSDHHMIYAINPITTKRPPSSARKVRSFKKCDPMPLAEDLDSAHWSNMDTFDDFDDKWSYWKTLFLNTVNVQSLKCIDSEIRMLMRSRNFYMRKFQKSRDPKDWECFCNLKNKIKKSLKTAKRSHFEEVCSSFTNKPKRMWDEINRTLGRKVKSRTTELKIGPNTITSPTDIANKLNSHFATCVKPVSSQPNSPSMNQVKTAFHFKPIRQDDV